MNSILTPRPDDRPPQREAWGTGVALSVAVHVLLVGALAWSVHWHSKSEPESASAELWSAVPQAAAPAPTEPPPPPPPPPSPSPAPQPAPPPPPPPPAVEAPKPPDIVTERLQEQKHKRELAQQKLDEQKAQKAAQDKLEKLAKAKADQQKADKAKADAAKSDATRQQATTQQKQLDAQKLAKLHDENVRRMMGQMEAPANATGTAARESGPSASYGGRIKARIRPNIVFTDSVAGNPATEVLVTLAPDGKIIGRRITKSSGAPEWDDAVLRAIDRTAVLPTDAGRVYPMTLVFTPQDN